jgi:hypothetical protein
MRRPEGLGSHFPRSQKRDLGHPRLESEKDWLRSGPPAERWWPQWRWFWRRRCRRKLVGFRICEVASSMDKIENSELEAAYAARLAAPHPQRSRPFAVQLIAAYLWLKAIVLIVCAVAARLHPSVRLTANEIIEGLVPMIMAWAGAAHDTEYDIWMAPLFAVVDATLGTGIWFLQKWARTIVVVDLAWLYGRALLGLPIALAFYSSHKDKVHPANLSVYFGINILAGLFILAALCDPDVRRAFRVGL